MQHAIIKFVNTVVLVLAVLVVVIVFLAAGMSTNSWFQAALAGLLAFVGVAFSTALWFCISGIYFNTKKLAEKIDG